MESVSRLPHGTGGTSSSASRSRHDGLISTHRSYVDTDWEAKEALRQRELEEARVRAAQMEKTMRWWSDCTANWREKWSKVRNERNRARDEAKMLRSKLEAALKDVNSYKRDKQELESHNEQLRRELERIHLLLLKHAGQWDHQLLEALDAGESDKEAASSIVAERECVIDSNIDGAAGNGEKDSGIDEFMAQNISKTINDDESKENSLLESLSFAQSCSDVNSWTLGVIGDGRILDNEDIYSLPRKTNNKVKETAIDDTENEIIYQKLSMLQLRLEEATKTLSVEREEKSALHRTLERVEGELNETRARCEELRCARQDAVREVLQLQDEYADTMAHIRADLMDETNSREGMDRRLADLRAQLERLQAENAAEWGKRERLDTEKLALERENKKMKAELRDAQERLERKGRTSNCSGEAEMRRLNQELQDKTKELCDLKHSHNKLKKVFQDKTTELAHVTRRAEQYEAEVKKLRGRVEELKRELAVAEDEVDSATNNIRKLQRTNDEFQEQIESLQVQVEHLQTRIRSSVVGTRRSPSLNQEDEQTDEDNF